MLSSVLAVLLFIQTTLAALAVRFEPSALIVNGETVPVTLEVVGGTLGGGEITGIRTVTFVPAKRAPKFAGNVTHHRFTTSGAVAELTPVYGLATKDYKYGYAVEVTYPTGESEWIDSELHDVKVVDPSPNVFKLAGALVVFGSFFTGIFFLATRLMPPGYWESVLPKSLHGFLPEKPKRK